MYNSYKYLDPDYSYIDPNTGVLRNLFNIKEEEVLIFVESGVVTKRLQELYKSPVQIKGIESLFFIHKHLFQDIYSWAGQQRTVEIRKGAKQFFPLSHFNNAYRFIDSLILQYKGIENTSLKELSHVLAEILDSINYLHPFREGNGRTQREFLRLLALEKGLKLNLNPINDLSVYKRYMNGTINSDLSELSDLIYELISKWKIYGL